MALYGVLFLGTTPLGAPSIGWIAGHVGVRGAMAIAGGLTLCAGAGVLRAVLRSGRNAATEVADPSLAGGVPAIAVPVDPERDVAG